MGYPWVCVRVCECECICSFGRKVARNLPSKYTEQSQCFWIKMSICHMTFGGKKRDGGGIDFVASSVLRTMVSSTGRCFLCFVGSFWVTFVFTRALFCTAINVFCTVRIRQNSTAAYRCKTWCEFSQLLVFYKSFGELGLSEACTLSQFKLPPCGYLFWSFPVFSTNPTLENPSTETTSALRTGCVSIVWNRFHKAVGKRKNFSSPVNSSG